MSKENEKIVYQGKMIEIVHENIIAPNGKEITLERGRRAPGVRLIIETPNGQFLISKEERLKTGTDYRLPGGRVFDSLIDYNNFLATSPSNEDMLKKAEEGAVREGMEEVGIRPTEMEFFYLSKCGGSFEWDLFYFVVKKYEIVGQNLEENEQIEVMEISRKELLKLAATKMQEDRSVGVILKYLNKQN